MADPPATDTSLFHIHNFDALEEAVEFAIMPPFSYTQKVFLPYVSNLITATRVGTSDTYTDFHPEANRYEDKSESYTGTVHPRKRFLDPLLTFVQRTGSISNTNRFFGELAAMLRDAFDRLKESGGMIQEIQAELASALTISQGTITDILRALDQFIKPYNYAYREKWRAGAGDPKTGTGEPKTIGPHDFDVLLSRLDLAVKGVTDELEIVEAAVLKARNQALTTVDQLMLGRMEKAQGARPDIVRIEGDPIDPDALEMALKSPTFQRYLQNLNASGTTLIIQGEEKFDNGHEHTKGYEFCSVPTPDGSCATATVVIKMPGHNDHDDPGLQLQTLLHEVAHAVHYTPDRDTPDRETSKDEFIRNRILDEARSRWAEELGRQDILRTTKVDIGSSLRGLKEAPFGASTAEFERKLDSLCHAAQQGLPEEAAAARLQDLIFSDHEYWLYQSYYKEASEAWVALHPELTEPGH